MLGISTDEIRHTRKRKKRGVTFNEDDEVINPEDVDPSVGRFRNLVQSTVIPSKVRKIIFYYKLIKRVIQFEENQKSHCEQ
jgi:nuclear inhibitor of protein phosphatase 1